MSRRSNEGQGENVALYMLDKTEIWSGIAEDFAESIWPIVVKVKRTVTQDELIEALDALQQSVRLGFCSVAEFEQEDYRTADTSLLGFASFEERDERIAEECQELMAILELLHARQRPHRQQHLMAFDIAQLV